MDVVVADKTLLFEDWRSIAGQAVYLARTPWAPGRRCRWVRAL